MDRSYQNLALRQENIEEYLGRFFEENTKYKVRDDQSTVSKRTVKFGYAGVDDATVIIFLKTGGLTTVQFKTGKNHELGQVLADYLYNTVDPNESLTVNLSLKGIDVENVSFLIEDLQSTADDEGNPEFAITQDTTNDKSTQYRVASINYKDKVVITHHLGTNVLQVQGKPLFCYRNISYLLSILLDQKTLFSVISHTKNEDQLLVREDVARVHIQQEYQFSYPLMDQAFKDLLVSSYCVKLASPELPEYSMLLYADLRVLEGVIRQFQASHGMLTSTIRVDVGSYFDISGPTVTLKPSYQNNFSNPAIISALEECYKLYRGQRHSLFHMSDIAGASRIISTLGEVMNLSSDIASKIECLYKS